VTIYLDNAATTPLDPAVREAMLAHLGTEDGFANPASEHAPGDAAAEAVEAAREQVAATVGAEPAEIVFTSGATEANNLAIKGVADFHRRDGGHIVTARTEHKSVIDSVRHLESCGWRVTWLDVDAGGRLDLDALADALRQDTVLVSVMHVNNEIGVIQDIAAIGAICRERGVTFHVDAAQSLGKLPIDVEAVGADLVSLSAHKLHGPKGIGALYVRRRPRARLLPQIHGGGHERGMRSGTLPTHQIVGMGAACRIADERRTKEQARIAALRDRLWAEIVALPEVWRNGDPEHAVAGILNVSVSGVDGEALLAGLTGDDGLAVSSGSACTSAGAESSYVLRALGRTTALAGASIRFSLGRFTNEADVDAAACRLIAEVERLRGLSPRWGQSAAVAETVASS